MIELAGFLIGAGFMLVVYGIVGVLCEMEL